jgi:RNA polymerase subunit RPABC4/transcription elongation factor Spt4
MGYKGCTHCGKTMKDDGSPCPGCGLTAEGAAVRDASAKWLCTSCGSQVSHQKSVTQGSFLVEILLWLLMILPGVLYSLWRLTSRKKVCPQCLQPALIPIDSPIARATMARLTP